MANGHLTKAELKGLLRVKEREECVSRLMDHHLESCGACRASLAELELEAHRAQSRPLEKVVEDAVALATTELRRVALLETRAQRDFRELLRTEPALRRRRVSRAIHRFANPVLSELLLERCKATVTEAPSEALTLADCSLEVALKVSQQEFPPALVMTLVARSHAYRANALRATGNLKQAEELLTLAGSTFEAQGNCDPLVEAEILMLTASLRIDLVQTSEAEELLDRARAIYLRLNENEKAARALIKKSMVLFDAGESERSVVVGLEALQALEAVGATANRKLRLTAEHNYTTFLQEVGRYQEAWQRLLDSSSLYASFPDAWTHLRHTWLDGLIQRGLGDRAAAYQRFVAAKAGFEAEGMSFLAALVGLDLAYLLVEEGRTAEVKALAEETVGVFLAQDLHRDASAAVMLFQQAARQEALTTTYLKQLVRYLSRTRSGPREAAS